MNTAVATVGNRIAFKMLQFCTVRLSDNEWARCQSRRTPYFMPEHLYCLMMQFELIEFNASGRDFSSNTNNNHYFIYISVVGA